jgi:phospholipid/cholesterol/gamma-HCH transport system ATP-binding protein
VGVEVPAIELIDVHTMLGGRWVLRGVNFGVPANAITVVLGPSGVGKTTCMRHITGLLPPDAGDVLVEGRSRAQLRKSEAIALGRRFGVLFQGTGMHAAGLWSSLTVLENMMFQLRAVSDAPERELRRLARERLREVGLGAHADKMPAVLSSGMTTRLALARALVTDPDFAVLDNIDEGLDPVRMGRLCDLVRRHQENHGGTYVVATHDMTVARRLASHLVVLWDGEVIEQGPPEQVLGSPRLAVRQLVTGAEVGPLALRSDTSGRRPERPPPPGDVGMYVPIPVVLLVIVTIIAASVLFLASPNVVEVSITVAAWLAAATVIAVRRPHRG